MNARLTLSFIAAWVVLSVVAVAGRYAAPAHAQRPPVSPTWTCSLDNIGATLTRCYTSSDPSYKTYVSTIVASSTTATGGQMLVEYGTGTNCGTGTVALFPSAASAVRFGYAGNAVSATVINLDPPLEVPGGKDLCVLAVGTNTLTVQFMGRLWPQ